MPDIPQPTDQNDDADDTRTPGELRDEASQDLADFAMGNITADELNARAHQANERMDAIKRQAGACEKPLELTENEQRFLAEMMRALETERPGWMFEVHPNAEGGTEPDLLWVKVTRILESVPQGPMVRNPMSRATMNNGDVEALAKGMARPFSMKLFKIERPLREAMED
jgi:hypothetical protein